MSIDKKLISEMNKIVAELYAPLYIDGQRIDEWCNGRCGNKQCGFGGTHKEIIEHLWEFKEAPHNWDNSCSLCKKEYSHD